jgi:GT2 family glycosyltransferase
MLDGCLAALGDDIAAQDEVIVVDSASDSADVESVALHHKAKYVRCDLPGASRARNVGWSLASHAVVAFVDDDVRVLSGWRDALLEAFEQHPDVTFVTGRISVPPGAEGGTRPVAIKEGDEPMTLRHGLLHGLGHSANLAVRRTALVAVGGFDEELGAGARFRASEDRDLFDRLQEVGGAGRYDPRARAWHEQWRSDSDLAALDFAYGYGAGARVAKLLRRRFVLGLRAAKDLLWGWGVFDVWSSIAARHPRLAVLGMVRLFGSVTGFIRGLLAPISNGHFVKRRPF